MDVTIDPEDTRAVVELEESLNDSFLPFGLSRWERINISTVREKRDGREVLHSAVSMISRTFLFKNVRVLMADARCLEISY